MKKFINKIEDIIPELIEGIVLSNPDTLQKVENTNAIARKNLNNKKVTIISGGGSGHEPAHAGFVGTGMLDAAVLGEIFTSPTFESVYKTIKSVANDKGVLLVIKNYTGDVLNFELAQQTAQAEGIKVESVIVDDDISLENSTYTVGKRGIVGTIFVHKIAGAAAELGWELEKVKQIANNTIANIASYGISLDGATVPANGSKGFTISDDEMEVGLGIHGEPGVRKEKIKSADESTKMLVDIITNHLKLTKNDEVAIIINGLGGTPLMELNIIARKAIMMMQEKEVKIVKTLVGNFMTAIEMPGFSISVLKLDDQTKKLLLAPSNTYGWTE